MKNKIQYILILAAAGISVFLSGCCNSVVYTREADAQMQERRIDNLQPIATGEAYNSGYYLFNIWPIYTGHTIRYNRKDYHAFYDDINPGRNASMLLNEMQKKYNVKQLAEVEHQESSWGYFSLWIIWRKNIRTTAVGLREPVAPEKQIKKNNKKRRFRRR